MTPDAIVLGPQDDDLADPHRAQAGDDAQFGTGAGRLRPHHPERHRCALPVLSHRDGARTIRMREGHGGSAPPERIAHRFAPWQVHSCRRQHDHETCILNASQHWMPRPSAGR